jgi:hypothetical protein
MCCGCDLAGAVGAEGAGSIGAAEEVDGPAGGCMLVPWLLACVWRVPIVEAGVLSAVLRAT